MSTLPPEIAVSEFPGGEVRYGLPRMPLGPLRYLGLLPIIIGAFIGSWPFISIAFFLSTGHAKQGELLKFALFGPLVCFGPICFPIAGLCVFLGLFIVYGHTEIVIRGDRLCSIKRCGPLRWTSRRRLDLIRGFRVQHGPVAQSDESPAAQQLGNWVFLKADLANGRSATICQGYPREWMLPLADDLALRCQQAASYETASATPIAVAEDTADPAVIQDRPRQPTNSTAILKPQVGGLAITIPPAGILRGSPKFLVVGGFFWNAMVVLFVAVFIPAAFQGQVKWEGTEEKVS